MDKSMFDLDRLMAEDKPQGKDYSAEVAERARQVAQLAGQADELTAAYLAGKLEGMGDALRMMKMSA